jgi:hypothetical protein
MSVEALIDDALPTPPDPSDSAEIVGFLRRFSNLISTGQNAGNLRRAAALIELLADRASEADRLSASLERAQADLGVVMAELEALRGQSAELGDACVMVPVATLRALHDQFEFVSNELAIRGGVVAQAMSEIARCAIEHAIADARPNAEAQATA